MPDEPREDDRPEDRSSDPPPRARVRRPRDYEDDDDRPRRRRRDDDYEDDDYDRPRRRPRKETGDDTGGLIPYKNGQALAAYYLGVFSLIPCLGAILGPLAVVFGFLGLNYAKKHPVTKGKAHAYIGIALGALTTLFNIGGPIVLAVIGAMSKPGR